jgi:hypothetical protein
MPMKLLLLFALPMIIGVALLLLSRWARRRNADLSTRDGNYLHGDWPTELRRGHFLETSRKYFVGDMQRPLELSGRILAAGVVIFVTLTMVCAATVLAFR